ncbi:MAG: choice-of-anchor D domain-containing protein [Ignavibacteriales bacterium]|nr:choice-of-anchor D domain-containing protein [Ignavibacteriales bacterium]
MSPQTVEFGAVNIGQNSQKTVTITNNGNADLTISQIVSTSGNISIGGYNSLVAPNSSVTVNLTFSPSIAQPYTGNINISSDDPDSR